MTVKLPATFIPHSMGNEIIRRPGAIEQVAHAAALRAWSMNHVSCYSSSSSRSSEG